MKMVIKFSIKLLAVTMFVVGFSFVFGSEKAAAFALNPNPRPNGIPSYNATMLENCNFQSVDKSPAFQPWLSDQYGWATQIITVPYGTTSVPLSNHWASAICSLNEDGKVAVPESRAKTLSATVVSGGGTVNGAAGKELILANGSAVSDYRHAWYNFTYDSAPLTTSKTIVISFEHVGINYITDGRGHTCIGGTEKPNLGGWFYDQCQSISYTLTININVVQTDRPPTGQVRGDCSAFNGGNASLVGWAIDPDRPVVNGTTPTPVRVLVYKDQPFSFDPNNQPIYNGIANLQTDGETQNLFGINGNYGFKIPISDYNDASPHNFYVYVVGVDANGIENGIYRQIYADPLAANAPGSGNPPSAVVGPCAPPNCSAMQPYVAGTNFPVEQPEVGQAFDLVLGTGYNPGVSANQTLTITANLTQSTAISGVPQTVTASIPPPTNLKATNLRANAAGTYTMVWTLNWNGGTRTCQGELQVVRKPYVKAYGNDVHAGGVVTQSNSGINDTSSCSINDVAAAGGNTKASVFALSREEGYAQPPPNNFYGASSQFAVSTLGEVAEFFSAGMHSPRRVSLAASPVTGLTFGNYNYPTEYTTNDWDPTNPNQTLDTRKVPDYGGNSGIVRCVPDYFAAAPANSQARSGYNIATLAGDGATQIVANGDYGRVNISGTDLSGKKAVYVDGDVVINENITLSGINGEANVPSLYLIVKGNIYIRSEVSRLDGVYIAQQDENGEGGAIYTCTRSASQQNILFNKNQLVDECNRQLVINGAFLADTIKFLRTNGTVQASGLNEPASSPSIAEVFNFSPETYIGGANSTLRRGAGSYDYITSLAPIL